MAVSWAFALPQPAITHTPAPGTLLLLTDFDDTGITVDAAALLVASAPGTTGSNPYADSDRGGTDSPVDGELGLGTTETVLSRIRRHSATEINLNDNDSPSALSLIDYFGSGGDGNDLTLYLQTVADGLVSFAVSAQISTSGGNFVRFTLPADAQTLLDNLDTGDRWIFALARTTSVTTIDHVVDAGDFSWAFAAPQPTVTHITAGTTDFLTYLWSSSGGGVFANAALKDTTWTAPDVNQETVVTLTLLVTDSGGLTDTDSVDVTIQNVVGPTYHTVNAGFVAWAFALPQPTITHTSILPQDYAVNAGTVLWIFDLPQPTITRTTLAPQDHTVDASALAWVFDLPELIVTHSAILDSGVITIRASNSEGSADLTIPYVVRT